jgi:hypothetical protein
MALPGSLLPWIDLQFHDAVGLPLAGGTVEFFEAGSNTVHKSVFTDVGRTVPHPNPLTLGADGRPSGPVYLAPGGYCAVIQDATGVQVGPATDGIEDVGLTWLESIGLELATGAKSVGAWYAVVSTDVLITVASSGGVDDPCPITLPPVAGRTKPLIVKNVGSKAVALYPSGSDTVDLASGVYTLPAAAAGVCPTLFMTMDGVSAWSIISSHGVL